MNAPRDPQKALEELLDVEERESRGLRADNLRRLNRHIFRHPLLLLGGLSMLVLGTFATLLEPRLFGYAIDEAIVPRDWPNLLRIGLLFLFVVIVRVVAVIAQNYLFEQLGQRVSQDLRVMLFARLQAMPVSVYDRNPAGRLLTRVTNDVAAVSEMFSAGFVSMAGNALMIVGILIWLVALDARLGLIAVAVFPPLVALSLFFSGRLKTAYRQSRSRLSALNAFLAENIMGMKVVQLFTREERQRARYHKINEWYAEAQASTTRTYALFQPSITLASGIAMALVIWQGGLAVRDGTIAIGVLAAYFSYVLTLFQPLREMADKWNIFLSGMVSAERIFALLSWEVEKGGDPGARSLAGRLGPARPIPGVRGHIVFENVWFAYEGDRYVLRDFSVEISPGMRVGIVGHTGAGKTTFINLLMRFYEPQRGRILLDGRDLREYDRRELRATLGMIQQDVFLFSGSLEDNIAFWPEKGSDEEDPLARVKRMLEGIGLGGTMAENAGRGRELQERASNLSFGERQLVAFARAFAADPAVWILDEATANLDSSTEGALRLALERAARGRTMIMIAHRLATVRAADLILVLHKGALIEQGDHRALLGRNGLYARLFRYQSVQDTRQDAHQDTP